MPQQAFSVRICCTKSRGSGGIQFFYRTILTLPLTEYNFCIKIYYRQMVAGNCTLRSAVTAVRGEKFTKPQKLKKYFLALKTTTDGDLL